MQTNFNNFNNENLKWASQQGTTRVKREATVSLCAPLTPPWGAPKTFVFDNC